MLTPEMQKILKGNSNVKPTTNNMQAEENTAVEPTEPEPTISPGPSMFNYRKVIPNSLTVLATVVGLSAFRLGLDGHFELGVLAILAAGLLDGLDGPTARALNGIEFNFSLTNRN